MYNMYIASGGFDITSGYRCHTHTAASVLAPSDKTCPTFTFPENCLQKVLFDNTSAFHGHSYPSLPPRIAALWFSPPKKLFSFVSL